MGSGVQSFEKHFKTQPPQEISSAKISSILQYLIFSGNPVYLTSFTPNGSFRKQEAAGALIDAKDDGLLLEFQEIRPKLESNSTISLSFGYRRQRAQLTSVIKEITGNRLGVFFPEKITLTNLRRNPRLEVSDPEILRDIEVQLEADTSVGSVTFSKGSIFEVSQLGLSLFLNRQDGLLLPGDSIKKLTVFYRGTPILTSAGIVSRTDMNKHRQGDQMTYQAVLLFESPKDQVSQHNRTSKRFPILDNRPCFFSAEHPLFPGRKIEGQVFEISTSGLSCLLEKTQFPVLKNMRFLNCQLQIPFCPPRELSFEVAHVDFRSDGEFNHFKIGGEFLDASVNLLKDIGSYTQQVKNEFVEDVTEADLDLLWEFMFETNFIYENKRGQIQGQSQKILETYYRLLRKENSIVKKVVFREEDEIKGHLSCIRFFDHAWIVQHLNALKSEKASAARAVVSSICDFFHDPRSHHRNKGFYLVSFFRPNNLYPRILFSESCRLINDTKKCSEHDFMFGIYDYSAEHKNLNCDLVIDESSAHIRFVNSLISKGYFEFIRAFGLSGQSPTQLEISEQFEELGLFRARHILHASDGESDVFALVELSSPGLNLSELTNAIYLFGTEITNQNTEGLANRLLSTAYERYFEPRGLAPIVLQADSLKSISSVRYSKVYRCWLLAVEAMAEFEEASAKIIMNFKDYIRIVKKEDEAGATPGNHEEASSKT